MLLYIRNTLDFLETTFAEMNKSTKDIELQWVSISQKNNKTILIPGMRVWPSQRVFP